MCSLHIQRRAIMNLYMKLHTNRLAWYLDEVHYGVLHIQASQLKSGQIIEEALQRIARRTDKIDMVVLEKPNLKLIGDNFHKIARMIILIQRHFGMLVWIIHTIFPNAGQEHLNIRKVKALVYSYPLNKDVQLSEARTLLHGASTMTPLDLLCLHDCMVMARYMKMRKEGSNGDN